MATFDTTANGTIQFGVNSITTGNATVSASANRAGTLGVYHSSNLATLITGTQAGQTASLTSGADTGLANSERVFIMQAVGLTSGAGRNASCSWTLVGGCDAYSKWATWTDTDQTTPTLNGAQASGATGAPSRSLAAGGNASVGFCANSTVDGNNHTAIGASLNGGGSDFGAQRDTVGGSTFSWTDHLNQWEVAACCLQSPAGGDVLMAQIIL